VCNGRTKRRGEKREREREREKERERKRERERERINCARDEKRGFTWVFNSFEALCFAFIFKFYSDHKN
jgi:hypothetical protein